MKRRIALLLTIVLLAAVGALLLTGCSFWDYWDRLLYGPNFEGFYYNVENGQVVITSYWGDSEHVVVPETIEGMPVVKIKGWTFDDVDIVSVTIPNSVVEVVYSAFFRCEKLQTIVLGENTVPTGQIVVGCNSMSYNKYGNGHYIGTSTNPYYLLVHAESEEITSISIHPDTKHVGYGAMEGCSQLVSVEIPTGVLAIGGDAFNGCTNLQYVYIPESVQQIGNYAFESCDSLANIEISPENKNYKSENNCLLTKDGVALIRYFTNQPNSICVVPEGTARINSYAFSRVRNLVEVVIPNSVEIIDGGAFSSCYDLQKVTVGNKVQEINPDTFYRCESLVEIEMPGVEVIDRYSFCWCSSLKSIGWSESLKTIDVQAFYRCESLEEVVIPNSVTDIDERAFEQCTSLKRVVIGSSVDYIGLNVFRGCSSLQEVSFVDSQGWKVGVLFYRKIDVSDGQQNAKYFLDKYQSKVWKK